MNTNERDVRDFASFTDREGHTTTYTYNATHGLLKVLDPLGRPGDIGVDPLRSAPGVEVDRLAARPVEGGLPLGRRRHGCRAGEEPGDAARDPKP